MLKKLGDGERRLLQGMGPHQTCFDFVGALGRQELLAPTVIFGVPNTERVAEAAASIG
jgi:hypothetical protein